MSLRFASTLLTILVLAPRLGFAIPPCYKNSQMRPIQEESAYFQNIGVFDDPDRKTADEYAAIHGETAETVKGRYAATGDFNCGGEMSQANLTIQNDIIVTAAHAIYKKPYTCKPLAKLPTCTFTVTHDGVSEVIPVQQMIKTGFKCPSANPQKNVDDWVVLKLKNPVSSKVKPYRINTDSQIEKQGVVAVGKSFDFTRGTDSNGKPILPRHYGDCHIKDNWGQGTTILIGTNCDSSGGTSGGGLFAAGEGMPPTLLGINQGSNETDEMMRQAAKQGTVNTGTYDPLNWNSVYVPVSGDLMSTLQDLGPNPLPEEPGTEI